MISPMQSAVEEQQRQEQTRKLSDSVQDDVFQDSDDSFLVKCSQAVEAKQSSESSDHVFNDNDDSFLVRCTQAAEAQVKEEPDSDSNATSDIKDDSMDIVMSQIPEQALQKPVTTTPRSSRTKVFARTVSSPPTPTSSKGAKTRLLETRSSTSGSIPKCSKEEIERKKQEALRRRKEAEARRVKSQTGSRPNTRSTSTLPPLIKPHVPLLSQPVTSSQRCYTQAEIERKRQEAISRRNRNKLISAKSK